MKVLVLNAGSSTQKSCLYNLDGKTLPEHPPEAIWKGDIDWLATADHGLLTVKANGIRQEIPLALQKNNDQGMAILLNTLLSGETKVLEQLSEIDIVAHRVVHGGTDYTGSVVITPKVKETIRDLIILAPNHNPAHVAGIEAIEAVLGNVTQVAVFDTAFHTTIPPKASTYPIPYEWTEKGIRRYGFHGISHQYCSERAPQLLGKSLDSLKLINCHLGNGCSLAAIKNGKSIDTTMGFTPLEGLMMGTRSGSIDPAIVIYLMREYNFTTDQLNDLLNKESGLKGVSGISGDLRAIFDSIDNRPRWFRCTNFYRRSWGKCSPSSGKSECGLELFRCRVGSSKKQRPSRGSRHSDSYILCENFSNSYRRRLGDRQRSMEYL